MYMDVNNAGDRLVVQGMADGEGFPDRSVAAQARNSVYSRGYLRRRQVELAEGKC